MEPRDIAVKFGAIALGVKQETLENFIPPDKQYREDDCENARNNAKLLYTQYYQFFHESNPKSPMARVYERCLAILSSEVGAEMDPIYLVLYPAAELKKELQLLARIGPLEELRQLYNEMLIIVKTDKKIFDYALLARGAPLPPMEDLEALPVTLMKTAWGANSVEEFVKNTSTIPETMLREMISSSETRIAEIEEKLAKL